MTVVVAGFDAEYPTSSRRFAGFDDQPALTAEDQAAVTREEIDGYRRALTAPTTAFIFSDSLLSREVAQGRMLVADSAQKIFRIPIGISIPRSTLQAAQPGGIRNTISIPAGWPTLVAGR
jgi:hypothetical protein